MRVAHKKDPRFREGFKSLVDSIGFFDPSRMTMKTVTLERSDRIGFMRLLTFERWTFAFAQVQVLGLTQNFLFEVAEAVNESLHAFDRHGVVDGSAEAAHGAVTLELLQTAVLSEFKEFLGEIVSLVGSDDVLVEHERNVHDGTVFLSGRTDEHLGVVEGAVKESGLGTVHLFDSFDTAEVLEPLESTVHHVHSENRRRIEHVLVVDVGLEVQHGRYCAVHLAEQVLADDRHGHASAADVLLSAAINDTKVRDVDLTGEEVGTHVCHEEAGLRLREVVPFRTVDGVVGRHVKVSGVVAELQVLVDAAVGFGLGVASGESVTEQLSFLVSLVCPNASQSVVGRGILVEEVHRKHAEQK